MLESWDSNEIYDAWGASPERAAAMAGAGEMWGQPPESERFDVAGWAYPWADPGLYSCIAPCP